MKIYGYEKNGKKLLVLKEASIVADVETLREIAAFINKTADEIEKYGEDFGHSHFQDYKKYFGEEWSDIIVCREK